MLKEGAGSGMMGSVFFFGFRKGAHTAPFAFPFSPFELLRVFAGHPGCRRI